MTIKKYLIELLLTKFKNHSEYDYTYVELFLEHFEKELNQVAHNKILNQRWVDGIFLGQLPSIHFPNKEALFTFITEHDYQFIDSIVQLVDKKQKEASSIAEDPKIGHILSLKQSLQANFYLDMKKHFIVVAEYKRLDNKLHHNLTEHKKQIKL